MCKRILRIALLTLPFYFVFCITVQAQKILSSPSFDVAAFLVENLKYPKRALNKNIEGKAQVKFLVNETGDIDSVVALTSIGFGIEEEAVRVIKLMPKWKPGTNDGIPTTYSFIQTVNFKLEGKGFKRQREFSSFKEASEHIKMSQYLLEGLRKSDDTSSTVTLHSEQSFFAPKQKDTSNYMVSLDSGVYRIVMSSNRGDFFMSRSASFYYNGDEVGGLFRAYEYPDELLIWHCRFKNVNKTISRFSNDRFIEFAMANPTLARIFISHNFIIKKKDFTVNNE